MGVATSNVNYIDCIDTATWVDTMGLPQSKTCFIVRQKCVNECVSGPFVCDTTNIEWKQMFGCFYPAPPAPPPPGDPGSPLPPPPPAGPTTPDDPGDGWDPDGNGYE